MAEGFNGGGIVSYDGSTPGITEGLAANLPASGVVAGDLYITTDTNTVYQWNGSGWVPIITGGGTGTIMGTVNPDNIPYASGVDTLSDSDFRIVGASGGQYIEGQHAHNYIVSPGSNILGYAVRTVAANTNLSADDYLVICDSTAGAITVNLLPVAAWQKGQVFAIKKKGGGSAVTIQGAVLGPLIDQAASYILAAGVIQHAIIIQYDGNNFWVISQF